MFDCIGNRLHVGSLVVETFKWSEGVPLVVLGPDPSYPVGQGGHRYLLVWHPIKQKVACVHERSIEAICPGAVNDGQGVV